MKPTSRKTTLVFDFDGTIADTLAMVVNVYNRIAPEYGCRLIGDDSVGLLRHGRPRELLRLSGMTLPRLPRFVLRVRKEIGGSMAGVKPFEGMPQVIRELSASSYVLGIVSSNGVDNVRAFLKANGLETCFSFIQSGIHLFGKDKIIRKLIRSRKAAAGTMVYIGDESRDIEAAKKAGIPVVAVSWGYQASDVLMEAAPTALVNEPAELVACIRNICTLPQ
jgi:phosphoglycolate phosphatase